MEIKHDDSVKKENKKLINETIEKNKNNKENSISDIHITNKKRESLNIYNENTMPSPFVQSLDNSIKTLFPKKNTENNNKSFEVNNEKINYEINLNDLSNISDNSNLSALDKLSEFELATKENNFSLRPSSSKLNLPSQKKEEKKQSPLQTSLTLEENLESIIYNDIIKINKL